MPASARSLRRYARQIRNACVGLGLAAYPADDLHTGGSEVELPFQDIDTRGLLDLVPTWLEDDALVPRVLVENPARLYDF